jgi:protein-export membrane protein SecD
MDLVISDLKNFYEKEEIKFASASQDTSTHLVKITGLDESGKDKTMGFVRKNLNEVMERAPVELHLQDEIAFAPQASYLENLNKFIVRQSLEKVRNRIDRYGVAEPSIHMLGSDRIAVELPGIKDPDRAIGIIKQAGQLEFKIVDDSMPETKLAQIISEVRKEKSIPEGYSIETVRQLNEALKDKLPPDTEIAFETQHDPVTKKIVGGSPYLLHRKAAVTGEMLKNASVDVQTNEPYVSLTFDGQGTKLFGEVTSENVGKKMAILLDGNVMKAPVIREPIHGGRAQITLGYGSFSDLQREAEDLVLVLQEGALPARLVEATKTVIGPSLGADSIRKGVFATIAGAVIVFIFMLIYYKGSGLIANLALMINLLFILSALALFQATLTLPGIAGIVLTLGIAVDSNVLIFERIREELRKGKTAKSAIESGYHNAMRTIIDANVTSLIAGLVLYQFGTGPIKGFAVTLIIGLSISMYTACVCTRMVYDYFIYKKKVAKVSI